MNQTSTRSSADSASKKETKAPVAWTEQERIAFVALSRHECLELGFDYRKGRFDFNLCFPEAMAKVPKHRRRPKFEGYERQRYCEAVISKEDFPSFQKDPKTSAAAELPDTSWADEWIAKPKANGKTAGQSRNKPVFWSNAERVALIKAMRAEIKELGLNPEKFNFTYVFERAQAKALSEDRHRNAISLLARSEHGSIMAAISSINDPIDIIPGWESKEKGRARKIGATIQRMNDADIAELAKQSARLFEMRNIAEFEHANAAFAEVAMQAQNALGWIGTAKARSVFDANDKARILHEAISQIKTKPSTGRFAKLLGGQA